mgnify:CR=1 FL=1
MLPLCSLLLILPPKQDDDDAEAMGDVDLFALAQEGEALTVNSKWLQHLEDRLLGEDGHPRKAREGEDPHRCGWVGVRGNTAGHCLLAVLLWCRPALCSTT